MSSLESKLDDTARYLRSRGLNEQLVKALLDSHTPTQIQKGFETLVHMSPPATALMILRGRFGYRKGLKKTNPGPAPEKGDEWPSLSPQEIQLALSSYLQDRD